MPPRRKPKKLEKRSNQAKANVAKRVKKAQIDRRAAENQDKARSGQLKNKKGNIATGGESTGRESGIMASQKANKIKGLEQSVGSLDRRIQNALDKGDTGTAKDLRSRLNKFTTKLGYERAIMHGGVRRNKDGKIERSTSGKPILNPLGKRWFDETKDQDFLDPTRKLQNIGGDAYGKMYPISNYLNKGPMWAQGLKSLLDKGKKTDIPYNLDDMPGVRYPLDEDYGRGEGATFFGGRSRIGYDDPRSGDFEIQLPEAEIQLPEAKIPYPSDDDLEAAIDRGIDPNFIFPVQDDPTTPDIVEADANTGSALQLAEAANVQDTLSDLVEQVTNQKNLNVSPNVFALPESVKKELNRQATDNVKTYELETYGKEITSDDLAKAGINEAYYNMNADSPIVIKQLIEKGVISPDQKTFPNFQEKDSVIPTERTFKDVMADASADALRATGAVSALNLYEPYRNMTQYVDDYGYGSGWTNYDGNEYKNMMEKSTDQALSAVNDSSYDLATKEKLADFIEQGGVDLTPQYFDGVQTTDPWNFQSTPVVFDEFVQERLNKLR